MSSPVKASDILANVPDPTASKCSGFTKALLRIPTLLYQFFDWAFDSDGNFTVAFKRLLQPTGSYEFVAAELTEDGSRLACNGQAVSRTEYAELYAVIGITYGSGDGSTTFNVPDFRDRFPVGQSATRVGGSTGGEETHALTEAELAPHTHDLVVWQNGASIPDFPSTGDEVLTMDEEAFRSAFYTTQLVPTQSAGGVGSPVAVTAHNNMPPYIACFIYIRT